MISSISKQGVQKLLNASIEKKLVNGCFMKVAAIAKFSKYSLELRCEVTHPLLEWQCGKKNEVNIIKWIGCSGYYMDIPEELSDKISQMKTFGTMTSEEANSLRKENAKQFLFVCEELGINK